MSCRDWTTLMSWSWASTKAKNASLRCSSDKGLSAMWESFPVNSVCCTQLLRGAALTSINEKSRRSLGGLSERYEAEAVPVEQVLNVLPNRDVVAGDKPLSPADTLFLDRFTARQSEVVWHLEAGKILEAVTASRRARAATGRPSSVG